MAAKEKLRSAHIHLNLGLEKPADPFDWGSLKFISLDLASLVRLEGEYYDLVKRCQREMYPEEIKRLPRKKAIRLTSSLLPLTQFLDDEGVLHLGGRLSRAKLSYDVLHPPIWPGKHPLAKIIRALYECMHHMGTDFLLGHVRQHFCVISRREAVKRIHKECVPCRPNHIELSVFLNLDSSENRVPFHDLVFAAYCLGLVHLLFKLLHEELLGSGWLYVIQAML